MTLDKFCVLPWVNLSTDVNGSLRPCCKFAQPTEHNEFQLPNMKDGRLDILWNDQKFRILRQAFLDGKQPKECQSCWDEEEAGLRSFRTSWAKDKGVNLAGVDFDSVYAQTPRSLDLKLNNVCNLKCRICSPQASSTFLKEYQKRYDIKIIEGSYWLSNKIIGTSNEDVFIDWVNGLNHLEITGGEPFASPENNKLIEFIVNSGKAKNISVVINTNGTLYNKNIMGLLMNFKHVTIVLSIDDLHHRFEYERYPAQWETVNNTFNHMIELRQDNNNLSLVLGPTISIFNVYFLPEYLEWTEERNVNMYYNFLHYPSSHSIKNLPNSLKDIVLKRLIDSRFEKVRNFLMLEQESDDLFFNFTKEVLDLDLIRQQSFVETFSDWGRMIMEFKK